MLQKFEIQGSSLFTKTRLTALRERMKNAAIDGFIIPRGDAHMGENVPERDERLRWLTGFTGSAGFAIITHDHAALFVDGRYTLQAKHQTDQTLIEQCNIPNDKPENWIAEKLPSGAAFGFDPMLHTKSFIETIGKPLSKQGITLKPVSNLIDEIWEDQPAPPCEPIRIFPIDYAGESSQSKRSRLGKEILEKECDAQLLTLPDSINWLLNIRGQDIARTPVMLGFALLKTNGACVLFVEPNRSFPELNAHLGNDVELKAPDQLMNSLEQYDGKIGIDPETAPIAFFTRLKDKAYENRDPCIAAKACKNPVELSGMENAHLRDGVAMVEFLSWLDETAPSGKLTEIDCVIKLEEIRSTHSKFIDISFETICGSSEHGAIIHYRVTHDSNKVIAPNSVLLLDSGAQYCDGTTDITRTIAIGTPPQEVKRPYTLVLKGMIALTRAKWPEGTTGKALDIIARQFLWQNGLNYNHGTGHGVGVALGVHEGPQSISPRGEHPIEEGMICSNEPGYYKPGSWGIRIENLVYAKKVDDMDQNEKYFELKTLTLCPIDARLIEAPLLSKEELDWLNNYHHVVKHKLYPHCSERARAWLESACKPI